MLEARGRRVRAAPNVPGQWSLALLAMALLGAAPLPALAQAEQTLEMQTGQGSPAGSTLTRGQATTYTLLVTNNGADPLNGAAIIDTPTAGLTCPAGNAVTIDYSGATPDTSSTVGTLIGSGIVLGLLNNGETATLTFTCNVNS